MAREVEGLVVELRGNLKDYEKAFAKARQVSTGELRKLEREAERAATRVERSLGGIGAGIKAGLIGALGGIGLDSLVRTLKGVIDDVGNIADEAARAGIDPETLQAFAFAAKDAGVEQEKITDLMQKFNLEIGEAAVKGGDLAKILAANGVALRDQNGNIRDTKSLFFEVVDLISNARTQQEAAVIAMAAFGKQAADALPFLQQGSQAIRQGEQAARDTGAVISNELVAKADEFSDRWARAWLIFKAHAAGGIVSVADQLDGLFEKLDKNTNDYLEKEKRLAGPEGDRIRLLERQEQVIKNIEEAEKSWSLNRSAFIAGWRAELKLIEDQLARLGPAFERAKGRSDAPTSILGNLARNPFDEDSATIIPDLGATTKPPKAKKAAAVKTRSLDAFQREIAQVVELAKSYDLAARSIGLSVGEVEKLETEFDLLNAAAKANITLTPEIVALIDQLAVSAGQGAQKVNDLQKEFNQAVQFNEELKGQFKSFFTEIANGVKPVDALTNALQRLTSKLLDLTLDKLATNLFQGGDPASGGGLGAFFAELFHSGGTAGKSISKRRVNPFAFIGAQKFHGGGEVPAILQRGEKVLRRGQSAGGNVQVIVQPQRGVAIEQGPKQERNGMVSQVIIAKMVNDTIKSGRANGAMLQQFNVHPARRRT